MVLWKKLSNDVGCLTCMAQLMAPTSSMEVLTTKVYL